MFRTHFSVVLLSVCLGIGFTKCAKDDPVQQRRRHQLECIEETRVDPDVITKMSKGEWRYIPKADVQPAKNWALCTLMKNDLMTKEGVYKLDVALLKVPKKDRNHAEKLIDSCLSTKAIPAADIAYNFVKCYQKTKANYTVSVFT